VLPAPAIGIVIQARRDVSRDSYEMTRHCEGASGAPRCMWPAHYVYGDALVCRCSKLGSRHAAHAGQRLPQSVCADMSVRGYAELTTECPVRAGLENYTAVEERLVEYVSAAQNVVTLNAQLTQLATQQLEQFVAQVRCKYLQGHASYGAAANDVQGG